MPGLRAGRAPAREPRPLRPVRVSRRWGAKRFPDRDVVADVRAATEGLEAGGEVDETRRLAGRVMARREMGKLVFLDLVDRSGRIQLMCDTGRIGDVEVHLGDVVGISGKPAKSRRGEPSLMVDELTVLARNTSPLPDTFHGLTDQETRYRKRYLDLLMNEDSRAAVRAACAGRHVDPSLPRRGGVRRGRDARAATALRRRVRAPVRHALERARCGSLSADRDRALPQAAHRRRARARVRDRQGLPERERLVQAPAGVHDARVVRGVRGLRRHDGPDRDDARASRARGARRRRSSRSAGTRST